MSISIIDNFTVNTTKNIDSRLGPYVSVAQATGSISTLLRYVGMTITITGSGQPVEYWFNPTTVDTDLVLKTASATGFVTTASFNSYTGSSLSQFAGTANQATTANNVNGFAIANVQQINVGEPEAGTYTYIIKTQELEQSKHTTINVYNNLNFI